MSSLPDPKLCMKDGMLFVDDWLILQATRIFIIVENSTIVIDIGELGRPEE